MLVRMAAKTAMGAMLVTGAAAALTVGVGAVGAALLVKRLCDERRGWRDGATAEAEDAPAA